MLSPSVRKAGSLGPWEWQEEDFSPASSVLVTWDLTVCCSAAACQQYGLVMPPVSGFLVVLFPVPSSGSHWAFGDQELRWLRQSATVKGRVCGGGDSRGPQPGWSMLPPLLCPCR